MTCNNKPTSWVPSYQSVIHTLPPSLPASTEWNGDPVPVATASLESIATPAHLTETAVTSTTLWFAGLCCTRLRAAPPCNLTQNTVRQTVEPPSKTLTLPLLTAIFLYIRYKDTKWLITALAATMLIKCIPPVCASKSELLIKTDYGSATL